MVLKAMRRDWPWGGPLIEDKLGYRASAWYRKDGGWIDRSDFATGNPIDENANSQETTALRVALLWTPTANLEITPSIFYQKENVADTGAFWESLSNPDDSDYRQGYVQAQPVVDEFVAPSLDIKLDLGDVELISVTSYFDRLSEEHRDYTNFDSGLVAGSGFPTFPNQVATGFLNDLQQIFTQEVRVQSSGDQKLQWVVGGFYSEDSQKSTQVNQDSFYEAMIFDLYGLSFADIGFFYLPGDLIYNSVTKSHTKQLAGFAQLDYAVTDKLTATAGLRVSEVSVDHFQFFEGVFAGNVASTEQGSSKETPVTPKFGLSYQASDDNLLYASIAKGFRPGGAQTQIPTGPCGADLAALGLTESPTEYGSDSLWSYEAGMKNTLMGGRVQIDANVFHIKWNDIQTFVDAPTCGSGFILNTGSLTSNGFDLSVQGRLTESLSLGVVMGYNDATFDETITAGNGALIVEEGDDARFGPKFTMTFTGQYDYDLVDLPAYLRFDYTFAGKEPENNLNLFAANLENRSAPSYSILNVRAGVEVNDIEVSLFVNNLTNSNPELGRFQVLPNFPIITSSTFRPRTMGLTVGFKY